MRTVGKNIIRTIYHLCEIKGLNIEDLEYDGIIEIQEDGTEKLIVHASSTVVSVSTVSARIVVDGEEPPPKTDPVYEYTQLAIDDPKVEEVFELRERGDHWVNLYRIYEYIQSQIQSEDNIVAQGWWTRSEKSRFKRTANSPEAIGHEARHHGDGGTTAPSDPMSHSEAKSLVDRLIDNWLQHRRDIHQSSE